MTEELEGPPTPVRCSDFDRIMALHDKIAKLHVQSRSNLFPLCEGWGGGGWLEGGEKT